MIMWINSSILVINEKLQTLTYIIRHKKSTSLEGASHKKYRLFFLELISY